MSLLNGSLNLLRFQVLGTVPSAETLLEGLRADAFRPFEDGLEEVRCGWCDWRNPKLAVNPDWLTHDRYAIFSLRVDSRRIPSALLKAEVDMRLRQLQAEKDLAFIGKEARISLQDDVKAELLRKVLPTLKVVEVAWNLKAGTLLTTATSAGMQSTLVGLFVKSWGLELHPLSPLPLAAAVAPELPVAALMVLDPLDLEVEEALHV